VVNEVLSSTSYGSRRPTYGSRQVTLVDLLDRLLGGGVVIQGHVTLAVADIDLVELDLGVLVGSIDKLAGR
jgi:Gas vesicle protein